MNNRELYLLVTSLETKHSLEEYLRALWKLGRAHKDAPIDAELAAAMLRDAASVEPPPFENEWLRAHATSPDPTGDLFADWERTIQFQIVELRRMANRGQLRDPQRYFGLTSPSGSLWYNFDPLTYLECGVRGTVGGYEEDEVVVIAPSPDGDDSAVFELESWGWEEFTDLLWCGQFYE